MAERRDLMRNRKLIPGMLCRHFKGNLYQIIAVAKHSETLEDMVVYQALYGTYQIYVRPLSMFFEVVNSVDGVVGQTYRFVILDEEMTSEHIEDEFQTVHDVSAGEDFNVPKMQGNERIENLFMDFLDARTYKEKLQYFRQMRNSLNEKVLNNIAATMDLPLEGEDMERQYEWIEKNLEQHCRFESDRFR